MSLFTVLKYSITTRFLTQDIAQLPAEVTIKWINEIPILTGGTPAQISTLIPLAWEVQRLTHNLSDADKQASLDILKRILMEVE